MVELYYNIDAVVLAPMKLTPRAWLACERTLLAWLHIAAILSAVAAGTSYFHSYAAGLRLCAILLTLPAIVFILYAVRVFHMRVEQLRKRKLEAHHDARGPFLMTFVMCFAVLLNLARQMWITFSPPHDSFDYNMYS
ncbi:MAG: hypothetical protein SGPRY_004914 [Prymnesium sp.]